MNANFLRLRIRNERRKFHHKRSNRTTLKYLRVASI